MTDETIFTTALDQAGPAARAVYLTEACAGDPDRRRRVEGLLTAHEKAGAYLEKPPIPLADLTPMATQGPGSPKTGPNETDDALTFLTPPTRSDSLGRIGHYEVLQVVGKGGFGIVFRAFDDMLQRVVAVKVMAPQIATLSPARKRFVREAQSSAQVRHENVVQVYEVGELPLPYLVMEFIPGETLQQKLNRCGPIELSEVLRIGRQIAEGLAAAHACELIHRDIKPGNILLEGGSHKAKITDFGLARAADDASISQSGIIAGTPMFMAPEQALGHQIDQRADLFSLGSVLYQMVSGRLPFRAPSTLAVLKRVAEEPPRPIPEIIAETPDWLCGIITKLHAKNPDDRFQSARQVADLLADCEAKLKAKQEVKNVLPGATRPAGRKWVAVAAVLLLPVIALAVTELAGVTHLLPQQATSDPIKPDGAQPPVVVVKKEEPPDTKVVKAVGKEPDPKETPGEKKTLLPDTKPPVEVPPPPPTVHDIWVKAIALVPLDKHAAALPAKLKERVPAFDDAFLRAIPNMAADRQKIMAEAWLKGRKPAFAGREDAWLKAISSMPADAQAVLVAAWLKERNPSFAGEITPKIEAGVVTSLEIPSQAIQDLSPLRALSGLKTLTCRSMVGWDNRAESDAAVLRSLTVLETINGKPVAQFWKDVDAKQAEFKEWLQLVPTLKASQQTAAVRAKWKERNPGFDGNVRLKIEDGAITEFGVTLDQVTDISPIRVLGALRVLNCIGAEKRGSFLGKEQLVDLMPLRGMHLAQLTYLSLRSTYVGDADMAVFKDCSNLTTLNLHRTKVTGAGMVYFKDSKDLSVLNLYSTQVGDAGLAHFKDCKNLTHLNLTGTPVSDTGLAHFKDCKDLTELYLDRTQVGDAGLAHFKGMPLRALMVSNTGITDLTPLQGMPLEEIRLTPKDITRGLDILRGMKGLKAIGVGIASNQVWPAAEFWERYDKGMFNE